MLRGERRNTAMSFVFRGLNTNVNVYYLLWSNAIRRWGQQNICEQVVIEKIPHIYIHVMPYNVSKYHLCDKNIYYYGFW